MQDSTGWELESNKESWVNLKGKTLKLTTSVTIPSSVIPSGIYAIKGVLVRVDHYNHRHYAVIEQSAGFVSINIDYILAVEEVND